VANVPWYDYQCEKCGTVFEVNRSMNGTGKAKCHACGSTRTIRIYSASPVVFKGSGFYSTDSGNRTSAATAPAEISAVTTPAETSAVTTPAETNGHADSETPKLEPKQPEGAKRKSA
jgi:putative FmdB family regulatory protein